MLGINELTVSFGERFLFNKISFIVSKTDRIGLVGKNGAGKSTLLKIMAG
ncbi:MAG: ATP-binding cassette domain-containing protein [Vicingaceae bacterium]|nr:ATP-binding cassette domain-containing protein [Vicingaceae bacterium]